jgi:hypothetical protein
MSMTVTLRPSLSRRLLTIVAAIAATAGAAFLPTSPASALGTLTGTTTNPIVYRTNTWYGSNAYQATSARTAAIGTTMTSVGWNYSLTSYPTGLVAQLCNQQRCVDLTDRTGETTAFAGDPAINTWTYYFRVNRSGTSVSIPTVFSQTHYLYLRMQ